MFKGITNELKRIANLMQVQNNLLESLLAEQCAKRERDGRRNRKQKAEESKLYAEWPITTAFQPPMDSVKRYNPNRRHEPCTQAT